MNPITDAQANAIEEVAKTTGIAIEALRDLGPFLGRVLGKPIENMVGFLGADYLDAVRARNAKRFALRTEQLLNEQNVESPEPVSPALAIPLLRAAQDESREALQELWAHLLANAMNPQRCGRLRQSFITTLRQFDPLDARVLQTIYQHSYRIGSPDSNPNNKSYDQLAQELGTTTDELRVSVDNLEQFKCMARPNSVVTILSPYGRLLMGALD